MRLVEVVGDENDRPVELALEADQQVLHFATDQWIQRAEGLVHQQDLGFRRQPPSQAHPLLHAARQLIRIGVRPSTQTDQLQRFLGAATPLGVVDPLHLQPVGDVLTHRAVGEQSEVLEDHGDALLTYPSQALPVESRDVGSIERYPSGGRLHQAIDHANDRRLARSGQAHDHEEFSGVDFEIDSGNGDDVAGVFLDFGSPMARSSLREYRVGMRPEDLVQVAYLEKTHWLLEVAFDASSEGRIQRRGLTVHIPTLRAQWTDSAPQGTGIGGRASDGLPWTPRRSVS